VTATLDDVTTKKAGLTSEAEAAKELVRLARANVGCGTATERNHPAHCMPEALAAGTRKVFTLANGPTG
jgi:hypothetical protein